MSCISLDPPRFGRWLHLAHGDASAMLRLQGGQVLPWRARGKEWLLLPAAAATMPGVAVRGGLPVIFSQFAQHGLGTRHGFARTAAWTPSQPIARPDAAVADAQLISGPDIHSRWRFAFALKLQLALTADSLELTLLATNSGDSPWPFAAALHSYLAVSANPALPEVLTGHPFQDRSEASCRSPDAGPLDLDKELSVSTAVSPDGWIGACRMPCSWIAKVGRT